MHPKLLPCIFLFLVFSGACKKEHDRPQWDVQVLGPLMHASLGINDLVADSLLSSDSSGAYHLVFDDTIYRATLDSLFQLRDTTIPTYLTFPFSVVLQPNTPFYSSNNNAALSITGVQLREVIIKSGYLRVRTRNRLQTRVVYTYTIPKATLNGVPFHFTTTLHAASSPGYASNDSLFDMSGYTVDLTGALGDRVNTLTYNVAASTDTGGTAVIATGGDTIVDVEATLLQFFPYYAKGYFGQKTINESLLSRQVDFFNTVQSGNFRLQSVTMQFTIDNNVGVDAQSLITQMNSVNTHSQVTVPLQANQLVNHTININRATESWNPQHPVNPSEYSVLLDNNNSNVRSFIENMPDRFDYSLKLDVNPLGNVSGSNDFVYSDYLIYARLRVDMPLAVAADHLAFADTSAIQIGNSSDYDPIGPAMLKLIADNGFPFDASLRLLLLDEHRQFLDSLPVSSPILAAPVDANFRVTAPRRTIIPIYVDEARKQRILTGKFISVKASFTTPAYPQFYQLYSDYRLNLKLTGDGTFQIR